MLTAEGWLAFFPSFQPLFSFCYIFSHFIRRSATYVLVNARERGRRETLYTLSMQQCMINFVNYPLIVYEDLPWYYIRIMISQYTNMHMNID